MLLGSLESGSLGVPVIGWDILLLLGLVLLDVVTEGTIAKSVGSKPAVESSVESGSGVTAEEKLARYFNFKAYLFVTCTHTLLPQIFFQT